MCIEHEQIHFIGDALRAVSISAAFQTRGGMPVYRREPAVRDPEKQAIRDKLDELLHNYGDAYQANMGDDVHYEGIQQIANEVSEDFGEFLLDGRLRIGIVQKALNLYLKYLWCLGRIAEPPHCPFDNGIIAGLNMQNPPNWTEMDNIDDYREVVDAARRVAGERRLSLAKWELTEWNMQHPRR